MTTALILSVNEVAIRLSLHNKLNVVVHAVQIVQTPPVELSTISAAGFLTWVTHLLFSIMDSES